MDVEFKVREILSNSLGISNGFSLHDKFTDLGADSLDTVELVIEVEESFGIEVTDSETDACATPQQLIELVERKLQKA